MAKEIPLILGVIILGCLVALGIFMLGSGDTDTSLENQQVEEDDAPGDGPGNVVRRHQAPVRDDKTGSETSTTPVAVMVADVLKAPEGTAARLKGRVLDPESKPVGRAVVALCKDVSDLPHHSLQGKVVATCETTEQGHFNFAGIDPAEGYVVRVEHNDFASKFVPKLQFIAGEEKQRDIRLLRGEKLSGVVQDKNGAFLQDVEILVVDQQNRAMDPENNVERMTRTKSDGSFGFNNLNPGYKRVTARKADYGTVTKPTVFVAKGREPEFLKFSLGEGSFIAGRVVDPENGPLEDAIVSAQPLARGGRNIISGNFPPVKTDDDGRFRYEGLPKGAYALTCHKKGYASRGVRRNAETGNTEVRIEMRRNPSIKGRVVDAVTGEAISRFSITMARTEYLVFNSNRLTQRFEDDNGAFEYTCDTNSGDLYLFATASGYAGGRTERLTLSPGRNLNDVVVPVIKGATVKGVISDTDGKGIGGARVELLPQVGGQEAENPFMKLIYGGMKTSSQKTTTDAEGNYEFKHVREGNYRTRGSHSAYSTADLERTVLVPRAGEVTFPGLILMKGGMVVGVVLDDDGKPAPNAKVQLVEKGQVGGGSYSATSGSDGSFRVKRVRPGIYWINVVERNGQPNTNIFEQLLKQRTRPEVFVEDGRTVTVEVK